MQTQSSAAVRPRSSFFRVFLIWTLSFAVLFFCCFCVYLLRYHKSFFRSYDGFNQHYIGFTYLGQWGRSIVRTLLSEHRLAVPLWNPAIGYGADIPTTLSAYLWDPFNWISFFVPSRLAEYAFAVMLTMKFYASGAAFLFYARHRQFSVHAALCGAVVYTFSCVSFVAFDQSFFINPMYIFPLLIVGADLLFDRGDFRLYSITLAWALLNYFYFAYMMCIFIFLYCLLRVITEGMLRGGLLPVLKKAGLFLACSVLAFALSAFHLFPVLSVMTRAGRLGLETYLPAVYSFQYYRRLYLGFITFYNMLSRDNIIGFPAAALLCVFVLFVLPWRKAAGEKQPSVPLPVPVLNRVRAEFLLLTAGLCLPAFGHLMNGFSYTANRWVWALALTVACMTGLAVTALQSLTGRQKACAAVFVLLYLLIAFLAFDPDKRAFLVSAALLAASVILILPSGRLPERTFRIISYGMICIMLTVNAYYVYAVKHNNGFANQQEAGTAWDTAMNAGGLPLLFMADTSDGSRYDKYGLNQTSNASWLYGVSGMNFYVSIYNDWIDQFHNSMALNTRAYTYAYNGLDRRSELEKLMGVGHYFTRTDTPVRPVGFSEPEAEATICLPGPEPESIPVRSWRSDTPPSLFWLYDTAVSHEDWQELPPLDRQQLLMKTVVLEDDGTEANALSGLPDIQPSVLSAAAESLQDMSVDGTAISVPGGNGRMLLKLDTPVEAGSGELCVYFDNINYSNGDSIGYSIFAQGLAGEKEIPFCQNSFSGSTYYNPRHGSKKHWLLNLGVPSERTDHILITFQASGAYSVDGISVGFRPREEIEENLSSLRRASDEIVIGTNYYSCSVSCDRESWLFFSAPYSTGWTVKDNEKPAEIRRADVAFMAVRLSPGSHQLEFRYVTPGLKPGLALSLSALAVFLFACFRRRKEAGQDA